MIATAADLSLKLARSIRVECSKSTLKIFLNLLFPLLFFIQRGINPQFLKPSVNQASGDLQLFGHLGHIAFEFCQAFANQISVGLFQAAGGQIAVGHVNRPCG